MLALKKHELIADKNDMLLLICYDFDFGSRKLLCLLEIYHLIALKLRLTCDSEADNGLVACANARWARIVLS